jgi:hypothetical protein
LGLTGSSCLRGRRGLRVQGSLPGLSRASDTQHPGGRRSGPVACAARPGDERRQSRLRPLLSPGPRSGRAAVTRRPWPAGSTRPPPRPGACGRAGASAGRCCTSAPTRCDLLEISQSADPPARNGDPARVPARPAAGSERTGPNSPCEAASERWIVPASATWCRPSQPRCHPPQPRGLPCRHTAAWSPPPCSRRTSDGS